MDPKNTNIHTRSVLDIDTEALTNLAKTLEQQTVRPRTICQTIIGKYEPGTWDYCNILISCIQKESQPVLHPINASYGLLIPKGLDAYAFFTSKELEYSGLLPDIQLQLQDPYGHSNSHINTALPEVTKHGISTLFIPSSGKMEIFLCTPLKVVVGSIEAARAYMHDQQDYEKKSIENGLKKISLT